MKLLDKDHTVLHHRLSRRKLLSYGLITAVSTVFPRQLFASREGVVEKELSFYNVNTHENLDVVYWRNGVYLPDAFDRINHLLRDARTGKEKAIDINLVDLLYEIKKQIRARQPFRVVSGYRSPSSNELLRKKKRGVARNSLHMYGKAVDITIQGYSLSALRRVAVNLEQGGVGYYPRSHFVHIDVGEVRYWRG